MDRSAAIPSSVDPTKPSAGRIYDHLLGGTEYLEVDRRAAEAIRKTAPEVEDAVWANRGFLQRSARWLAETAGIRQFIDIGAGLPTRNNTHEAAQAVAPDARVVYVDNDPTILEHSRALLANARNTAFINGDLRDPDGILNHPEVRQLIDFSQPVGLMLAAVVHFLPDEEDPWGVVQRYVEALPSGSYLALSHATSTRTNPNVIARANELYANATEKPYFRPEEDIARFFEGLEIVPPYPDAPAELTYVGLWGAEDPEAADTDDSRWLFCAVARKP
ncbi:MAG TPA: SAM-dependent methyltransferase [Actinopolymorphaceae bacterium]